MDRTFQDDRPANDAYWDNPSPRCACTSISEEETELSEAAIQETKEFNL